MISIVCPFYNEARGVGAFFSRLIPVLDRLGEAYEVVCVNDGSRDGTLAALLAMRALHPDVRVIDLSRNFGKEAALTAGLDAARGDAVIPIDVDLQDSPELITKLVQEWRRGFEVVLAKRADRRSDSFAKRLTAFLFYRLHNSISSEPLLPENVGDFRLMDRKVVEAIKQLPERRRFMKGIFAWVGFRSTTVEYVRDSRFAGESRFTGWKLWNFALEGITSFSTAPLRIWTYLGLAVASLAFVYAGFIIMRTVIHGIDVPGYASLLAVTLFLGGIQLIGLGVLGEYLGRVYSEAKQRPIYIVRDSYEASQAARREVRTRGPEAITQ
jgi:glycosyltransferase involved in cell wall biosynthesis